MANTIKYSKLVNIIKEEISKLNENGFDQYDMEPQAPLTKQQQIDASWNEFNNNNRQALSQQLQNGEIESYLDSNLNTNDYKGQLGMDAQSQDQNVADTAKLTIGTPRQTAANYDNYSKQKYGTYGESKNKKLTMKGSQFKNLVKECLSEVLSERKQLKESDEFKPSGYRTVSNLGGHEVQIHPSGDSARFKFYGGQPTDWMEIEFDENGAAYVETERGRELLADYMRYQ